MHVTLQPAFILHSRPYRESSMLLDIFSQDYGRIGLIARGVRNNRSKLRSLLQPFIPLLISWRGKSELMTLQHAEPHGPIVWLQKEGLLSGFYLNELLIRLLQKHDPHKELYTIYQTTLLKLGNNEFHQQYLRLFEKKLLKEIGYGLQLSSSIPDNQVFLADRIYRFYSDHGFELCNKNENIPHAMLFSGKSLLALATEQLEDPTSLKDAKRLMRIVLGTLLGDKPLHSRKLFKGIHVK